MNLFKKLRESQRSNRQHEIEEQAKSQIKVADFNGKLFIAVDGAHLFPIEDEWTPKEILLHLNMLRDNYVKSRSYSANTIMF